MRALVVVSITLAALVLGAVALRHRGLSSRMIAGDAEITGARRARDWMLPAGYAERTNPVRCGEDTLNEARAHWADHCAGCHANNGSGDSFLGKTMFPHPPDMRGPATQAESDGAIYYAINQGIPFTGMPAFGESGDHDADSWKLVCFVRHLPSLSAEEEYRMRELNPKTESERAEEREEQEFLNGGAAKVKETRK
jgi:mono/diheme cytochrome c family protein